ncbi:basic salivary proline-rich protein 3-like [Physeter macrocephalus]|uniref:Basic salivary proline-rich protein 3-like n=1 Tax=Physeter macrocephalus TaxID=9755 RepID=A0A2Y9FEP0_PHYMC|nr:basic salivary proline-rich protein 3-like [Physeter catodon]|eukprot:XP_007121245.1 basic salivary proline-rich protein 3-like [Physeter catodon]
MRPQSDSSPKSADLGFAVGLQINLVQAVSLSRPHFFSPSFVLQASREGEPVAVPGGQRPGVSKTGAISVSRLRASTRRPHSPRSSSGGRGGRQGRRQNVRHITTGCRQGLEREGSQARSGSTGPRQEWSSGCDGEKPSSGSSREPRPPQQARGAGSPTRPSVPDPRPGPGPGAPSPPPPFVAGAEALPRVRSSSSRRRLPPLRPRPGGLRPRGPLPLPSLQTWGPKASPLPSPKRILLLTPKNPMKP